MSEKINRVDFIDKAKGILIIFVVLGHIFLECPLQYFIYTFHMPAFFIINGILLRYSSRLNRSFFLIIKSKIYTLLVPYLFFEVLGVLLDIVNHGFYANYKGFIFNYIYNVVTVQCSNYVDWFLIALFIAQILFTVFYKSKCNKKVLLFISFILISGTLLLPQVQLTRIMKQAMIAYGMLLIGYYCNEILTSKLSVGEVAVALIITLIAAATNYKVDINYAIINNPLMFLAGGIGGTYFILQMSQSKIFSRLKILNFLGKNTLIIMGIHPILIGVIQKLRDYEKATVGSGIEIFLVVLVLCVPFIYMLNRFLPFLVGKNCKNR